MVLFKKTLIQYGRFPFKLLGIMIFLRFVDLLWIQSSYVPDEYWQNLEVAHKKVFGYGYLTWEWGKGIRSYFYVAFTHLLYSILNYLKLDYAELIIFLPRIFQGLLSALADVYFIRWVHEKRSGQFAWGLLSWITTFFISYCSTRTLINTFEMNLTVIALYHYPVTPKSKSFPFVLIVALLSYIRPTAALIWLPLVTFNIFNAKQPLKLILQNYLPVCVGVLLLNVAIDFYYYGQLFVTPYNFLKVNVIDNISSTYGSHDILWYWYAGLPTVLGIQILPFYLRALLRITKANFVKSLQYDIEAQMIFTILWTVSVLSFIPHKEFRFLLPLAPLALFVSSGALSKWSSKAKNWQLYIVGTVLITTHISALIFFGRFHLIGPSNTMSVLRNEINNSSNVKLLFLAPCHSFPLYSHIHKNIPVRFLTCTPNFGNDTSYITETDKFYQNPPVWLRTQYATLQPCTLPSHVIKYDSLNISNFLHVNNYTLIETIFNSYYYPNNTGAYIQIYKRPGRVC